MQTKLLSVVLSAVFSVSAIAQECPKPRQGIRITATGDVLLHKALFEGTVNSRNRFDYLWSKLIPSLQSGDLTVGNLEGPVAPGVIRGGKAVKDVGYQYDGRVYSGTDMVFNYHPYLIEDLKKSGFNLLTTANNHSLDRGALGIDRTIDQLNAINLDFVGTRKSDSNETRGRILNVRNYKIGVISCTESHNGHDDNHNQVLECGNSGLVDLIGSMSQRADAVIVFPHWGSEYKTRPNDRQKNWANKWIKAGALAVVGNHPHVLQTTDWIQKPDGRMGVVVYSLGNFIAAQAAMERRVSAVLHLDLVSGSRGLELNQFSYTPFVRPRGSLSVALLKSNSEEAQYVRSQLGEAQCQ